MFNIIPFSHNMKSLLYYYISFAWLSLRCSAAESQPNKDLDDSEKFVTERTRSRTPAETMEWLENLHERYLRSHEEYLRQKQSGTDTISLSDSSDSSISDASNSEKKRQLSGLDWVSKLDHGSIAHYPSLQEATDLLDSWIKEYPDKIRKSSIGKSLEDRDLTLYVLGDKKKSKDKPEFLLTGLTHSREPGGLVVVLYFIGMLLTNPTAASQYYLEERSIYVIPFVNPDGYVWNSGSRTKMKRKNGRKTCKRAEDSGVDLNRNFATHWKRISNGCSEEYSGTEPFSEPETKALKALIEKRKFRVCSNIHSYGSMLTHPYNSERHNTLPKDQLKIYQEINRVFHYAKFGTAQETVGYLAYGESDDWMYDQGIISMSPEVGHEADGFWPKQSAIMGIAKRNFVRTSYLALKTGCEIVVQVVSDLSITIKNDGLDTCVSPTLAFKFSGPSKGLDLTSSSKSLLATDPMESTSEGQEGKTWIIHLKEDIKKRKGITLKWKAHGEGGVKLTQPPLEYCSLGSSRYGENCQCKKSLQEEASFRYVVGPDMLCQAAGVQRREHLIKTMKLSNLSEMPLEIGTISGNPILQGLKSSTEVEGEYATSKAPATEIVTTIAPTAAATEVKTSSRITNLKNFEHLNLVSLNNTNRLDSVNQNSSGSSLISQASINHDISRSENQETSESQSSSSPINEPTTNGVVQHSASIEDLEALRQRKPIVYIIGMLSALALSLLICNIHSVILRCRQGSTGDARHLRFDDNSGLMMMDTAKGSPGPNDMIEVVTVGSPTGKGQYNHSGSIVQGQPVPNSNPKQKLPANHVAHDPNTYSIESD